MPRDELEQLLKRAADAADLDGEPTASPVMIADRARVLVRRHRRIRVAACATTGVAMLLLLVSLSNSQSGSKQTGTPILATGHDVPQDDVPQKIVDRRQEIERLRADADRRMRLVTAVRAASRPRPEPPPQSAILATASAPLQLPASLVIEQEAEVTARIMLEQGSRWMQQSDHRADGIRSYQRTIELFPNTVAARVAQERLQRIENQPGVKI